MNHPAEGTLQAFLDGETAGADTSALERHLRECDRCQGDLHALRAANDELVGALALLNFPAPIRTARQQIARRRARTVWGVPLGRAAVLLIGVSTALSATIPGSPVRDWIAGAWGDNAAPEAAVSVLKSDAAPVVEETAAPLPSAGVSVRPADGRMRVVFVRPARGLRVIARLHDGEQVEVSATGLASGARFRTGPDRIEIANADTGEVRIEIPRTAARFALEVDGRVLLSKEGENLRVPDRGAGAGGPEILLEVQR